MLLFVYYIAVNAHATEQDLTKLSRITAHQKTLLVAAFKNSMSVNKATLAQLVQQTSLSKRRILQWFMRRRNIIRRGITEETLAHGESTSLSIYIYIMHLSYSQVVCVYLVVS